MAKKEATKTTKSNVKKSMVLEAMEYHGIEKTKQLPGESDFDCANRLLTKNKIDFIVRVDGTDKYIIFSRLTINAIATKITMQSSLHSLLMVQEYIAFIDEEISSY